MDIREERDEDALGIQDLHLSAFEGPSEAVLVEKLRLEGDVSVSLVAVEYGEIIGHILFSPLQMASNGQQVSISAVSLAPVAVAPTHQNLGIGSELIRQGIEKCEENKVDAIFVLGSDVYYPRFGFSSEKAECIKSEYSGHFFMVLELKVGIFDEFSGNVIYPDAFNDLS